MVTSSCQKAEDDRFRTLAVYAIGLYQFKSRELRKRIHLISVHQHSSDILSTAWFDPRTKRWYRIQLDVGMISAVVDGLKQTAERAGSRPIQEIFQICNKAT